MPANIRRSCWAAVPASAKIICRRQDAWSWSCNAQPRRWTYFTFLCSTAIDLATAVLQQECRSWRLYSTIDQVCVRFFSAIDEVSKSTRSWASWTGCFSNASPASDPRLLAIASPWLKGSHAHLPKANPWRHVRSNACRWRPGLRRELDNKQAATGQLAFFVVLTTSQDCRACCRLIRA